DTVAEIFLKNGHELIRRQRFQRLIRQGGRLDLVADDDQPKRIVQDMADQNDDNQQADEIGKQEEGLGYFAATVALSHTGAVIGLADEFSAASEGLIGH